MTAGSETKDDRSALGETWLPYSENYPTGSAGVPARILAPVKGCHHLDLRWCRSQPAWPIPQQQRSTTTAVRAANPDPPPECRPELHPTLSCHPERSGAERRVWRGGTINVHPTRCITVTRKAALLRRSFDSAGGPEVNLPLTSQNIRTILPPSHKERGRSLAASNIPVPEVNGTKWPKMAPPKRP